MDGLLEAVMTDWWRILKNADSTRTCMLQT